MLRSKARYIVRADKNIRAKSAARVIFGELRKQHNDDGCNSVLAEAVKALTSSNGVDPDEITETVKSAVGDRLVGLRVIVTDGEWSGLIPGLENQTRGRSPNSNTNPEPSPLFRLRLGEGFLFRRVSCGETED